MAMPAYPPFLRPMLRATKSRTQPASFSIAEPRRGMAYARRIGTDVPVFWDCQFRFTRDDALIFKLWFNEVIDHGTAEFTLPILTEFGLIEHTCRFLDTNLLDTSEAGETVTYKATIMARAEVVPPGYSEAAALISSLENWKAWSALLDQVVTVEMPMDGDTLLDEDGETLTDEDGDTLLI